MMIMAWIVSFLIQPSSCAELAQNAPWVAKESDPRDIKERDPFRMPDRVANRLIPKGELENFRVEELKLIGVIEGFGPPRGMLLAPNGRTYLIRERQRIGLDGGVVAKILSEKVIIFEKRINLAGEEEGFKKEILLPAESYAEAKHEPVSNQKSQQSSEFLENSPRPLIPSASSSP